MFCHVNLFIVSYNWIKIAESFEECVTNDNHLIEIEVEGKKICLAKHKDTIYACAHKCPHAGGKMAEGYLDALGNIVCPIHRYKFNLQNGRNVSGEGYFLKNFPVEIRKDGVFVGFKKNIFGK
jgi:nitrite reductase/ring-hydroxylating ferredoxin subunit